MISEEEFLKDIERLYSSFERKTGYVKENYSPLIFRGDISYSKFIKIHNFKSQIPLPIPNCSCKFEDLSDALRKPTVDEKLLSIGKIRGFRLAMASAVLHFSNPEEYPIIDVNVIAGMRKLGWKTRSTMDINKGAANFYKHYRYSVRRIAKDKVVSDLVKKFEVTPIRLVEAALYSLGKGW